MEEIIAETYQLLADVVVASDIGSDYHQAMSRILNAAQESDQTGFSLLLLPFLSCLAAGGEPRRAIPAAAAWRALHIAAQLLDDVEDGDVARMSTAQVDAAQVINLSTGFIALASLALTRLPPEVQPILFQDFNRTILQMAGGQHTDLNRHAPLDLDSYFQMMAAKSGSFFALAARAGAACATLDSSRVAKYERFGYNVGIMIQVADDIADFHKPVGEGDLAKGLHTLPALYALNVASSREQARLEQLLALAPTQKEAEVQVRHVIVTLGAEVYMRAEAARHRNQALAILTESTEPPDSVRKPLRDWLEALPVLSW